MRGSGTATTEHSAQWVVVSNTDIGSGTATTKPIAQWVVVSNTDIGSGTATTECTVGSGLQY